MQAPLHYPPPASPAHHTLCTPGPTMREGRLEPATAALLASLALCGGGALRLVSAARPLSGTASPAYTRVDTPEAFRAALQAGVRHIVVAAHLDFSEGPTRQSGAMAVASTTRSIRVRSQPWSLMLLARRRAAAELRWRVVAGLGHG